MTMILWILVKRQLRCIWKQYVTQIMKIHYLTYEIKRLRKFEFSTIFTHRLNTVVCSRALFIMAIWWKEAFSKVHTTHKNAYDLLSTRVTLRLAQYIWPPLTNSSWGGNGPNLHGLCRPRVLIICVTAPLVVKTVSLNLLPPGNLTCQAFSNFRISLEIPIF